VSPAQRFAKRLGLALFCDATRRRPEIGRQLCVLVLTWDATRLADLDARAAASRSSPDAIALYAATRPRSVT